jgi:RNAse (barnase) inhibitor barstar
MAPFSLGDSFILSGIVHYYAERCEELHVPAQSNFLETLTTLYQDHPNIKVVCIEHADEVDDYAKENKLSKILGTRLQAENIRGLILHPLWDQQLYANHELPFSLRYKNFKLPKHVLGSDELYQRFINNDEPYGLIHRYTGDHPQGIPINVEHFRAVSGFTSIKLIDIDHTITTNMMHYLKLIKNAQEIHCVASSFHCLVDSIDVPAKLFFHDVREKTSMLVNSPWNNYKWTIVNYNQKL